MPGRDVGGCRCRPLARAGVEVAVGDQRAVDRQAQLAAVGVPGEARVVAVGGELVEHPQVRRVGDARCGGRRRVGRARRPRRGRRSRRCGSSTPAKAIVVPLDASSRSRRLVRSTQPRSSKPSRRSPPGQLGVSRVALAVVGQQVPQRVAQRSARSSRWSRTRTRRARRAASPSASSTTGTGPWCARLSPVLTTRSGSRAASAGAATPACGAGSASGAGRETCSTRSGRVRRGQDRHVDPAQREPAHLDAGGVRRAPAAAERRHGGDPARCGRRVRGASRQVAARPRLPHGRRAGCDNGGMSDLKDRLRTDLTASMKARDEPALVDAADGADRDHQRRGGRQGGTRAHRRRRRRRAEHRGQEASRGGRRRSTTPGAPSSAAKERAEAEVIAEYLPEQLTEDEISALVDRDHRRARRRRRGHAGHGPGDGRAQPQVEGPRRRRGRRGRGAPPARLSARRDRRAGQRRARAVAAAVLAAVARPPPFPPPSPVAVAASRLRRLVTYGVPSRRRSSTVLPVPAVCRGGLR